MTLEIISLIINFLLGGGLIVVITNVATLKYQIKKTSHEADAAKIENEKQIVETFQKFIVEPIKKEINVLKQNNKNYERAIARIGRCPGAAHCPVIDELQNSNSSNGDGNKDRDDNNS